MRSQDASYFAALDGLRAFSILFVVLQHIPDKPHWLGHLHGWLGVDIFFVLSGFLITYLLDREKQKSGRVDLAAFYTRRAFRILPVYSVMLAIYVVVTRYTDTLQNWNLLKRDLPYFLTFLNEFAKSINGFSVFGFSWTLGVEEKFYLFWPVLFFIVLAFNRRRTAIITTIYVLLVALASVKYEAARSYSGLLVGSFLALGIASPRTAWLRAHIQRIPAVIPLASLAAGFWLVDRNRYGIFIFSWTVLFLVAHLLTTQSWLRSFLSTPILTWLGKRSYGMYLVHMLALTLVERFVHLPALVQPFALTVATFALSAVFADVLFRFIESPTREYGKRLLARRRLLAETSAIDQPALATVSG
jgi:peptidoglycan/LPS O-acetylase OafA/YrhL